MIKTMELTTEIPDSRELVIRLPRDVPAGTARILLEVAPEAGSLEDLRDIEDARKALAEAEREGAVTLAQLKDELGI